MMNLSLIKKMTYAIIIIALLIICIPTIKTFAMSNDVVEVVLQKNTKLLDNNGQEIGMIINRGHELKVYTEIKEIDGVKCRQTLFQANGAKIKVEACEVENSGLVYTDKQTTLYDLNGNVIGMVEANVELGMVDIKNGECILSIDGFIKEDAFEDASQTNSPTNYILDLITRIIGILFNSLLKTINLL